MTALGICAAISLVIWVHMIAFRGQFWRLTPEPLEAAPRGAMPEIVAVVPARNEADVIAKSIGSLLAQNYSGTFSVVLVDDQSEDGTKASAPADPRLTILDGAPCPPGWVGKMWAVHQGIDYAAAHFPDSRYVFLTDADIAHDPGQLNDLVAHAEGGDLDLVSRMAQLQCTTLAESLLIPAFVYFFAMLYPFRWVGDRFNRIAGAAGGCMLVRRSALESIGGIAAIQGALIDDCALAAKIKALPPPRGGLELKLTRASTSLRPYGGFREIGRMVSRSAFTQLDYSWLRLVLTVIGLALIFLSPIAALAAGSWPAVAGGLAYAMMALSFLPILDTYGRSPLWALALPVAAACYLLFTLQSAFAFWSGRGGQWKGRFQAQKAHS